MIGSPIAWHGVPCKALFFVAVAASLGGCQPSGSILPNVPGPNPSGGGAGADATVYIVDQPEPGNETQFKELPGAIAYLCGHLSAGQQGAVVIQTNRELAVETLTFDCAIGIGVAQGFEAKIIGPGPLPLTVNASGSLGLAGLSISNPGGVIVNCDSDLDLESDILPNGVTVNIGGVAGLGAKSGVRMEAGDLSAKWTINSNQLGDALKLSLVSNIGVGGKCEVTGNQGDSCTLGGGGSVAGQFSFKANLFKDVTVETKLKASAGFNFEEHQSLQTLGLNLSTQDSPTVTLKDNVAASANISLFGQASATLNLTSNSIDNGNFTFSVSDLKIEALNTSYGKAAIALSAVAYIPVVRYTDVGSVVKGPLSFTALDEGTENGKLTLDLKNVTLRGDFQADLKCQAKFQLGDGTNIAGKAHLIARGNVLDLADTQVKWDAGLTLEGHGVEAGITVNSSGATFKDKFGVHTEPTVAITVNLTDAVFGQGSGIAITGKSGSGGVPKLLQPREVISGAGSGGIYITNSDINGDIGIFDVDGPVSIKDSKIDIPTETSLFRITGAITINGNTFQGGITQLNIVDSPELTIIENNSFSGAMVGAIHIGNSSRALIQNNPMITVGSLGLALTVDDSGAAHATRNQITGSVLVALGGVLKLDNNTFASALVNDATAAGGLVNDPVSSNAGLSGLADVLSPIDFDGNGCRDYPLGCNVVRNGVCTCGVGLPPAPDPGF